MRRHFEMRQRRDGGDEFPEMGCMSNTKETGSRRLDSRPRLSTEAGAHTANEADADLSDSPLTSHTTGEGGWVGQCEESQSITYSVTFD